MSTEDFKAQALRIAAEMVAQHPNATYDEQVEMVADALNRDDDRLGQDADDAAMRIIGRFPELESSNIELLRQLLAFAWLDGVVSHTQREQRRIEAELILRGAEL